MIQILPIGSGSTGNCMYVNMDGIGFLVDIGVSWRACRTALAQNGILPMEVQALFLTHAHNDHVRGMRVTMKNLPAPVWASRVTKKQLGIKDIWELKWKQTIEAVPGLRVTAFETSHDCPGSCGYVFETESSKFGYATDLGIVTEAILEQLTGCQVQVMESNHDVEMLKHGPYPPELQRRILSDQGHLSNEACAAACRYLAERGTKAFLLAHLSQENNRPEVARSVTEEALDGTDAWLDILPVYSGELLHFGNREQER